MTDPQVAVVMLGIFVLTIMLGFPICFTLMGMGIFFGYYAYYDPERMQTIFDNRVFDLLVNQTYSVMANDVLVAVPLFLFMGYIVERANLVDRLFLTLQVAARNMPGSMAIAALATCAMFATASGIIGAVVTLMGLLAFPAMLKARYNTSFAAGVICAGGCLGILIPPSIMLIVYAAAASMSVVRLYAGAILPGFLLAGLYIIYVLGRAWLNPELAPKPSDAEVREIKGDRNIAFMMLTSFLPLAFLILAVLGAIMFGLATPTEAASMGAGGGLVLASGYRIASIRSGDIKPEWVDDRGEPHPYNPWFYAIGAGGVTTIFLYVVYFAGRILANAMFDAALPLERTLPFGPGVSLAIVLAIAVAVRYRGDHIPILGIFQPRAAVLRPLYAFGGQAGLVGLGFGVVYTLMFAVLDLGEAFADHEFTPWTFEIGFFVTLFGWMGWKGIDKTGLKESVYLTVRTSAMVCWLFVGSWTFSSVFSYLGGHSLIEEFIIGMNLSPIMFLIMAQIIIFLLGWPLEWSEIIIIFVPIFLPLLPHFGIDPLFFGILVALNLQTSFLTPPMAMAAYYLKGVAPPHVQLIEIFKGVMPFLSMVLLAMVLLYTFPEIAMWLPKIVYGR
ncbi:MAG: TRAP transporter large permease subunit [Alphaproteobacteria bacterium]|nr:TRAP transporter large permease subunit [Alphaproteobacteria bacterium]